MKILITAIGAFILATSVASADMTNGAFFVDNDVECRLIAQSGATTTNQFLAGYTYTVGEQLMEMDITKPTMFYFAGGPIVRAGTNSTLIINIFEHEVKNCNVSPRKAEIGQFNLTLGFNRGEFVVVYPKTDSTSTFGIMTPHTGDPFAPGKYVFVVDETETTVNVLDKENIIADKRSPTRKNPTKSKTKTITVTKALGQDEITKYGVPIAEIEKKADTVMFIIVNGNVVGVLK